MTFRKSEEGFKCKLIGEGVSHYGKTEPVSTAGGRIHVVVVVVVVVVEVVEVMEVVVVVVVVVVAVVVEMVVVAVFSDLAQGGAITGRGRGGKNRRALM